MIEHSYAGRKRNSSRLRDASSLQGGFPNPERTGCPDKSVLRAIASREINPEKLMDWIGHLGFCSPCYCEYAQLRRQAKTRQWVRLAAIAACITVLLSVGIWLSVRGRQHAVGARGDVARREEASSYQVCRLDLRNRVVLRGERSTVDETPIELPRRRLILSIYLPPAARQANMNSRSRKNLERRS